MPEKTKFKKISVQKFNAFPAIYLLYWEHGDYLQLLS